jgi:hypothetical protein
VGKGRRQLQKQRAAVSFLSDVYVSTDKRRYHSHQAEETIIDGIFSLFARFFWSCNRLRCVEWAVIVRFHLYLGSVLFHFHDIL